MSLFDHLVTQALSSHEDLVPLRPVVEKELLHHDILREMERFLPPGRQLTTAKDPRYWDYLTRTIRALTADLVPRPRPHDYP